MPLSKERMRERKRLDRLNVKPESNLSSATAVKPSVPLYNPSFHRAGDTVRVLRGRREVVVTIPRLDADGNIIPSYE